MAPAGSDQHGNQPRQAWLSERAARRQQVMDDLAKPGASLASVAKQHGISKQRVYQIKKMQAGK
jgi:poly(3-hydroxybutyrate) depolymerase